MSRIYLSPIGAVNGETLSMLARHVGELFGFDSEVSTSFPEPDYAFDARRGQYSSTVILRNLSSVTPPDATRFVGVTGCDLYIPMITFVYGQAQLCGRTAIISLARLGQAFYGLRPNKEVEMRRARKEIAHELGHTFGLVHCGDRSCLMSLSTEIVQVDLKSEDFCASCWKLLDEEIAKAKRQVKRTTVPEMIG